MVKFDEIYYRCTNVSDDEDNEYVSAVVMDRNLLEAKEVYRKENGL